MGALPNRFVAGSPVHALLIPCFVACSAPGSLACFATGDERASSTGRSRKSDGGSSSVAIVADASKTGGEGPTSRDEVQRGSPWGNHRPRRRKSPHAA